MPATLKERFEQAKAEAQTIYNAATESGSMSDDEAQRFAELTESAKAMREQLDLLANGRAQLDALAADVPAPAANGRRQSPGEAFVNSDQYRRLVAQYPSGIPTGSRVSLDAAVNVGSIRNTLMTDPGTATPLHVIDAPTGVAVFDLLNAVTIIDDAPPVIKHFTATLSTNAAAVAAEGAAAAESAITWANVSLSMDNIAHHIPVTNQALTRNSMMRQIVDAFMSNGVRARVQTEIATDLAAWSGLTAQAYDTNLRTTLRKAVTKAMRNGAIIGAGAPSILLSANDAETLDLEMLSSLTIQNGTGPQTTANLWRLPIVVAHSGLADGFAYVGDLRQIVFYTTGQVNVSTGWVNTQFTEGEQTILANTEGVTGVLGAAAIVKADLTA